MWLCASGLDTDWQKVNKSFGREISTRSQLAGPAPNRARVHVAMVGYLTHHIIDNEIVLAVLLSCNERKGFDHESLFTLGWNRAMLSEDGHRSITGIAVEDRELEWHLILAVPG